MKGGGTGQSPAPPQSSSEVCPHAGSEQVLRGLGGVQRQGCEVEVPPPHTGAGGEAVRNWVQAGGGSPQGLVHAGAPAPTPKPGGRLGAPNLAKVRESIQQHLSSLEGGPGGGHIPSVTAGSVPPARQGRGGPRDRAHTTGPAGSRAHGKALGVSPGVSLSHGPQSPSVPPPLQSPQPPLLVQLLEEGFAELVGADHDGTGGGHLNDTGQEPCKDRAVSPTMTPGHPKTPKKGVGGSQPHLQTAPGCPTRRGCGA